MEEQNENRPFHIVLVEPQIPQNTGNIARTCAATGSVLHLVGPLGFQIDDKKLKRAGLDYWHLLDIRYYDGLEEFFQKNTGPFYYFSTRPGTATATCGMSRGPTSFSAGRMRACRRGYCSRMSSGASVCP